MNRKFVTKLAMLCVFCSLPWQSFASEDLEELLDCEGKDADSQLCIDKEEAFELKARIEVLFPILEAIEEPPWDAESYAENKTIFAEANELYDTWYFSDAKTKFQKCLDTLVSLQQLYDSELVVRRTQIDALIESKDYENALPQIEQLLKWIPDDQQLVNMRDRSQVAIELKEVISTVQAHIEQDEFERAAELLKDFPSGYWVDEVRVAKQKIFLNEVATSYKRAMSQGYEFRDNDDLLAAKNSFDEALRFNPNSTAAQEALDDVNERLRLIQIEDLLDALEDQEHIENWEGTVATIGELEKLNASSDYIDDRRKRVSLFLEVEARLAASTNIDIADFDKNKRQHIQELLEETQQYIQSDRIRTVYEEVATLFDTYTTPVKVTLRSDRRTTVRITPGKSLGRFKKKVVKVLPGSYEISGTRKGFHQVVQNLVVKPNSETIEVEIVCSARF